MPVDREQVMAALRTVQDPELFKDLVTLNMVKNVSVENTSAGPQVSVLIELTTPACPLKDKIEKDVKDAIRKIGGGEAKVEFSANTRGAPQAPKNLLPQVKNFIAVGAGKGGVGKSTVALNIAVGLARAGAQVGLMDGDVYGPSMPTMLHLKGQPPQVRGNHITPFFTHGIHVMTIGAIVEDGKPMIWRGPMAQGAFKQLLAEHTEWPDLDYLIIDLPPGTGDITLTLCQTLPVTGAVIVATPQQVALDDAIRAVRMFQQLGTPVLGVVENMRSDIFGSGGAERAAQQLNLPFLGAIGLYPELRMNSDSGDPSANFTSNPKLHDELESIVKTLAGQISIRNLRSVGPELTVS